MTSVRRAAVAGTFYPAEVGILTGTVERLLREAVARGPRPKALVVPHAGYVYSGPVAASAYCELRPPLPTRVVAVGPAHFEPLRGLALPESPALETPLGQVPLDPAGAEAVARLPFVGRSDGPHLREHSIEVQLPFLQRLLGRFTLLPLAVGRAEPAEVAAALELLWGGEETLIVVSTDLSHYLTWSEARERDGRTAQAVVALRDEAIGPDEACGYAGLRGFLRVARSRCPLARQLDLRSSGDTAGGKGRVVGYGAFSFAAGPSS
jgi:AmmeMemoRadiSam system protein B